MGPEREEVMKVRCVEEEVVVKDGKWLVRCCRDAV